MQSAEAYLISVEKAYGLVEEKSSKMGTTKELSQVRQELLLEDLIADRDYPPFNRVMMDGVALSYDSYREGINSFKIQGVCPAGTEQMTLELSNNCLEVMTGCVLPKNTSLVIPYEEVNIKNGTAYLKSSSKYKKMENVHLKGSDKAKGDIILDKKNKLNGPHIGIAASLGYEKLIVQAPQKVGVISTGDELVDIDQIPKNYQIRKSNVFAIKKSLELFGIDSIELTHLKDDPEAIKDHYNNAKKKFDVLIYSGGVSKGKFDYLPNCWQKLGVTQYFHGVAQKPGKPLWFGVDEEFQTQVYGLPGNPVSSLVCLHRYFFKQKPIWVELCEDIEFKKPLTYFLPVKILSTDDAKLKAMSLDMKNSGDFSCLAESDGFVELPASKERFLKGECYSFYSWSPLWN